MSIPLQKSKLFLPPTREQSVARPRLISRLDGLPAPGCRLALVCAPAGSGKTTLVGQWLRQPGRMVAWVSLDARDNLPARFFGHLIAACRVAAPQAGKAALEVLELPGANLEEVVTLLANDLAEAPHPFLLALDDYHTITSPALHRAVDLLVDSQPPGMRMILLSREDPALRLAVRRARGELIEVRQEDLRFNLDEALTFLNRSMGLALTTSQVERLETRTEGWITGLQLAALSLQRAPDADRFIQDFSGSHRFILDYLVEEVLEGQSAQVQSFLMSTAILERFCAGLCAAVTGETVENAGLILEQLSRANLFLVPLDEERSWFRYHHLFGDLLRTRLSDQKANHPEPACLHHRASIWHAAHGDPRLAVEHALTARDWVLAADLIQRHILAYWQNVDLEFFQLVNRLPGDVLAARPSLCLHSAWFCVITGQIGRVLPLVEAAETCLSSPGRPPEKEDAANRAFTRALRAYLADTQNQPVELDDSLEQAWAAIPESSVGMRNSVAVLLGTICFMEGSYDRALRFYEDVLERDRRVDGTSGIPIAVMRSVWVLLAQGRLREAYRLVDHNLAYIQKDGPSGARRYYVAGGLNLAAGEILLEWGRFDEAKLQIREGLRLIQDWPMSPVHPWGLCLLSRLQAARADLDAARQALAQAAELIRKTPVYPRFMDEFQKAQLSVWIQEDNRPALEEYIRLNAPLVEPSEDMRYRYEARRILLCRAWLAAGSPEQAAGLLERLLPPAEGRNGSRMIILALLASARCDPAVLETALSLALPEGYLYSFIEMGEPMRLVLKAWLTQEPKRKGRDRALAAYARQALAAFEGLAPAALRRPTGELVERLSQREEEVLVQLAKGLSNQQIAERLVISIRTVKKHVENINGKLGAQNRTQAVVIARELGLLERPG